MGVLHDELMGGRIGRADGLAILSIPEGSTDGNRVYTKRRSGSKMESLVSGILRLKETKMKSAWNLLCCIGLLVGLGVFAQTAEKTWTGKISDSMCGASHAKMMAEHTDAKMTDRDCTLACVKAGGKFVFVSGGKVYTVANQKLAALTEHAGETVSVTGDVKGDTITVAKVAKK